MARLSPLPVIRRLEIILAGIIRKVPPATIFPGMQPDIPVQYIRMVTAAAFLHLPDLWAMAATHGSLPARGSDLRDIERRIKGECI